MCAYAHDASQPEHFGSNREQRNSVCSAMNIITTQAFYFAPLEETEREAVAAERV
jgi:hypothetical protein